MMGALALTAHAPADMFKPSAVEQVKLGKRVAADIRKKEKVLPATDERVLMVRRVAASLMATFADEKPPKPWEFAFDVIDSKEMNAFALPGGPTFFYSALLAKFKTEDQLAAVMAHELTHTRKEHWAYAYADQQKRALGLSILLILVRANRTTADLASIANDVVISLPHSRRQETESDDIGYEMMVKAGYNPQGMSDVFKILREASKGGKPPEFLSTHPDDKNRIKRIDDRIVKQNKTYAAQKPLPWATP